MSEAARSSHERRLWKALAFGSLKRVEHIDDECAPCEILRSEPRAGIGMIIRAIPGGLDELGGGESEALGDIAVAITHEAVEDEPIHANPRRTAPKTLWIVRRLTHRDRRNHVAWAKFMRVEEMVVYQRARLALRKNPRIHRTENRPRRNLYLEITLAVRGPEAIAVVHTFAHRMSDEVGFCSELRRIFVLAQHLGDSPHRTKVFDQYRVERDVFDPKILLHKRRVEVPSAKFFDKFESA